MTRVLPFAAWSLFALAAAAQQAPVRDTTALVLSGTSALEGTVVSDEEVAIPLRSAIVRLARAGSEDINLASTDASGRYVFRHLAPGSYTLTASKGSYVSMAFGAPRAGLPGAPIVLGDADHQKIEPIRLMRGAIITGRVLDRHGRGVQAEVTAAQYVIVDGERRRRTTSGATSRVTSNAHGDFRIFGLLPGEYLVSAAASPQIAAETTADEIAWAGGRQGSPPPPGRSFLNITTFHPSAADTAAASFVRLQRGEERSGVDVIIQAVQVSRLAGTVLGPDGQPASNVTIYRSLPGAAGGAVITASTARTASDGRFGFSGVVPGMHTLLARTAVNPTASQGILPLWGRVDVPVSGTDVNDVVIRLERGRSIRGTIVAKGAAGATFTAERVQVRLVAAPGTPATPQFAIGNADGTFQIDGVPPGRYRLAPTASGPWRARSAMAGSLDAIDTPIEIASADVADVVITFTDQTARLAGALRDAAGRPAQFYVFAFPVQASAWFDGSRRFASARADAGGRYEIANLPAGEYYVCALTELDAALQFDPSYLEQLIPAATKVTLGDGEQKQQDFRVGR